MTMTTGEARARGHQLALELAEHWRSSVPPREVPRFTVRSEVLEGTRWWRVTDRAVEPPVSMLYPTSHAAWEAADPSAPVPEPMPSVEPEAGLPIPRGAWRREAPGASTELGDRDPGELIAAGEAAYLLGCTTKTVQRWSEQGLLDCERPIPERARGHAYQREPDRRYRLGEVLNLAREKRRRTFVVDRRRTPRDTATEGTPNA